MSKIEHILPFIWTYLIALFIISAYKGFAYDMANEKIDPNYKGWHSISFKSGRIWFAFPILLFPKSKDKSVIETAKSYNKIIFNIYITTLILVIIYLGKN